MFKKSLFTLMISVLLLPFGVDAAISNEEIAKRLFNEYDVKTIEYTVWSMYHTPYDSDINSEFYLAFKLPTEIATDKLAKVIITPENFAINSSGTVNHSTSKQLVESFGNLNVEKNGVISCGSLNSSTYSECKGNDYCNYWCGIASDDIKMVEYKDGNLNFVTNSSDISYFIYDNPGERIYGIDSSKPEYYVGKKCEAIKDKNSNDYYSCKLNRILHGYLPNDNGIYINTNEQQAVTSIQARSFKTYKSSLKNVNKKTYSFSNSLKTTLCKKNPSLSLCKNVSTTVSRPNEEICAIGTDGNCLSDGQELQVLSSANGNYAVFKRTSTRKKADVTAVSPYYLTKANSFEVYEGGTITKYLGSKKYQFIQEKNHHHTRAIPVKFKVQFQYYVENAPVVQAYSSDYSKTCNDNEVVISNDKYKRIDNGETFDLIATDGGTVNTSTDNYSDINPFCYKTCKATLQPYNLQPVYNSSNNYVKGNAYKAGMGFNWNFSLAYSQECTIKINRDINFYNNVEDADKEELLKQCGNVERVMNSNSIDSIYIDDYKYGFYNNDGSWNGTNDDLILSQSGTVKSPKMSYNYDGTTTSSAWTTTRVNSGKINNIKIIKQYNNGERAYYTTDKYACVLKGSGTPVSCEASLPHVTSNTTYPIHPQMNTINEVPLNLVVAFRNGTTIEKQCDYNVVNELFGLENDPGEKKATGLDVIYRPISLDNPFPGVNNDGIKRGGNWDDNEVATYITNNRGETTNQVYGKEPLYRIRLNASTIQTIRNYNNSNPYDDFNLTCDANGFKCKTTSGTNENILTTILNDSNISSGTCINSINYYTCAEKTPESGGETP